MVEKETVDERNMYGKLYSHVGPPIRSTMLYSTSVTRQNLLVLFSVGLTFLASDTLLQRCFSGQVLTRCTLRAAE